MKIYSSRSTKEMLEEFFAARKLRRAVWDRDEWHQTCVKGKWPLPQLPYRGKVAITPAVPAASPADDDDDDIESLEDAIEEYLAKTEEPDSEAALRRDRKRAGLCPECGKEGQFLRMALVCPEHGVYAGC